MFGPKKSNGSSPTPSPRTGADVARLSTNLLQVILQSTQPPSFLLFLNGESVPAEYVDNIVVSIEAPRNPGDELTTQAILSRKAAPSVNAPPQTNLFPGVIDIVGLGRRVTIIGTPDGDVSFGLGLEASGFSTEAHGAQTLSVLFTQEIASVNVEWTDGLKEDLFPIP